jgi:methylated-DNA-[protein]-cysteine S-methyltransferase
MILQSPTPAAPSLDTQSPTPTMSAPTLPTQTRYTMFESQVGELLAAIDSDGRLTRLHFHDGPHTPVPSAEWTRDESAFVELRRQLDAYFAGELESFDLDLAPSGTPFQREVWSALCTIPYGATASYGEIAHAVGQPGAARAVGGANNRNPIAIVIPCHRVIGAGGSLTGYGGGLPRKRWLLALEAGAPTLV